MKTVITYNEQGRLSLAVGTCTGREAQQGLLQVFQNAKTNLQTQKQKTSTKRNVVWQKERE